MSVIPHKQHECFEKNFQFLTKPCLILFGDSLTQLSNFSTNGWGNCLIRTYGVKADVIIRGFSGYTSVHAQDLLDCVFDPIFSYLEKSLSFFTQKPKDSQKTRVPIIITCLFGSNDASLDSQKVSVEDYEKNMLKVFENLNSKVASYKNITESCDVHLISISPPPMSEKEWLAACPSSKNLNRTNENTRKYVEALKTSVQGFEKNEIKNLQLHFLDLNDKIWSEPQQNPNSNLKDMFADGLHLSEKGNIFLFEQIMQLIRERIPNAYPEKLEIPFPHWSKMV